MNTTSNDSEARTETDSTEMPNAAPDTGDATTRAVEGILDSAVELGGVWIRYGLEVGRLALRTQSAWLKGVSQILEHVADAIDVKEASETGASESAPQ
jgi:hypothetical protein